jgi:CRP/FNR family cyclic AMP-dependent transcriptional regulator
MKDLETLLAGHAFFKDLAPEHLKLVAGCGSNVRFKTGAFLFREGRAADRFFALRKGAVGIELHAPGRPPLTVQTLEAGEIVGWSWLFPPYQWQFDGRAREEVAAVSFDGACLRRKCDADAGLGYALMKRLARLVTRRLEATRLQVLDLYGSDARI